ncbi:MAG: hypothetical protein AAFP08_14250, partial [Bacteroidota bacterium]
MKTSTGSLSGAQQVQPLVGIKETKELFKSMVDLKDAVKLSTANDGKLDIPGDLPNFINPLFGLPTAIQGIDQIPAELRDLDQNEIAELREDFGDLVDDPRYIKLFGALLTAGDA